MFSNFIDVLQGPAVDATDEVEEGDPPAGEDPKQGKAPEAAATTGGAFSIWGMASALADTVKKTTAEVAARYHTCPPGKLVVSWSQDKAATMQDI